MTYLSMSHTTFSKPFVITTPIPYTNAAPHLGHLLEGVYNDSVARWYRERKGIQTLLTMGLDQHGLKIYQAAQAANQAPEVFVTEQGKTFEQLWKQFGVCYDAWIPTTSPKHKMVASLFWKRMVEKGVLYSKPYTGLYNLYDEVFILEKDLDEHGDLPGRPGKKPVILEENNYFFKLTEFKDRLIDYLNHTDIQPAGVRQEMIHFLEDDLQDVSFSRDAKKLSWGIPVPGDTDQVMYVWCDALTNYATACVDDMDSVQWYAAGSEDEKKKIESRIWQSIQDTFPIDLMYLGKDIARFHLLYWPAMLMACGITPPKTCYVHGMINAADGRKMSKSLGNGVLPDEFVARYGVDGARFLLLHEINLLGDTNFDWAMMDDAFHAHLANNVGNLLMRVTTLCQTNFTDGLDVRIDSTDLFSMDVFDTLVESGRVREAIDIVLDGCRKGNELLEQTKPWTMFKEGRFEEAKAILIQLLGLLYHAGSCLQIVMPETGAYISAHVHDSPHVKAKVLFARLV
jgi:methionyl-tRNA synthetase